MTAAVRTAVVVLRGNAPSTSPVAESAYSPPIYRWPNRLFTSEPKPRSIVAFLAELSTPNGGVAPDSTPRRIVSRLPSVEIEVVQFDHDGTTAVPYFRMRGESAAEFRATLEADSRLSGVRELERTDEGAFYRAEWEVDSPLVECIARSDGVIIEAEGDVDEWRLKIWFEGGTSPSTFQQCCADRDVPIEVDRVTSLAEVLSDDDASASGPQREAMVLAYREGYFEEPRQVSQAEIADELGISSSAAGRRLRRGFENLVGETLID